MRITLCVYLLLTTVVSAAEARTSLLSVGSLTVGTGGTVTPAYASWLPDSWLDGTTNEFQLEFVTVGDPGNPAKTGTLYKTYWNWDPGAVPYTYRIMKYEVSYGQARRMLAASGLPLTIRPAVTGVADEDDRPASKVIPREVFLLANWLNTSKGYRAAYNCSITGDIGLWPEADSWVEGGVTNRLRHREAFYFVPSLEEYFKAAQWNPYIGAWQNYAVGDTVAPTAINGFYGGAAIPGTEVILQNHDERYPEYNYLTTDSGLRTHSGNVSAVTLTTSGGVITGVTFNNRVSGYAVTNNTVASWTITQGAVTSGSAVVATYQTNRVVAQFEILNGGAGYNANWPHLTNGVGTVTLAGNTVNVRVWADDGVVKGIYPLSGNFATEDTTTTLDIVQAGGSNATCRAMRYVNVHVPATFGAIAGGSGYTNGPATIRTAPQPNIWQEDQPWQGAAPVKMAGGLSPYGVMGLDGNVHEFAETEVDGVNDRIANTNLVSLVVHGDRISFFSSYWNVGGFQSGHPTEYKAFDEAITSDDATYEAGFRFASRVTDTFGTGTNAFWLGPMVTIEGPITNTTVDGLGYMVGDVPYSFAIQKFELTEDVVSKIIRSGLPWVTITQDAGGGGGLTGTNKPVTCVNPKEIFAIVNWMNESKGYQKAYNTSADGITWDVWPPDQAWGYDGGVTNYYRHKDCVYFLPSWGELTVAARWNPATRTFGEYYGAGATSNLEGYFLNGGTNANATVNGQRFDARFPEWDSPGNVVNATVVVNGTGGVTNIVFDSYVSGHNYQTNMVTAFAIVQAGGSGATASIASFQTITNVPGTFTNYVGGAGYTTGAGTVTLGGDTVTVTVFADSAGAVKGIMPTGGKFAALDYSTVLPIVQAGGSNATCTVYRYSNVTYGAPLVPLTWTIVANGTGYTNGPVTFQSQSFTNHLTIDPVTGMAYTQICIGAADVDQAGGLSPTGVMGLGGNVSDWSDTALDMTNDLLGTFPTHTRYMGGWWYRNNSIVRYGGSDSASYATTGAYGNGFRVARKVLP